MLIKYQKFKMTQQKRRPPVTGGREVNDDIMGKALDDMWRFNLGRRVDQDTVADSVDYLIAGVASGDLLNLENHRDRVAFLAHYANPKEVLKMVDEAIEAGGSARKYGSWKNAFLEEVGRALKKPKTKKKPPDDEDEEIDESDED